MNYRIILAFSLLIFSVSSILATLRLGNADLIAAMLESIAQLFAATALGSAAYLVYEYVTFRQKSKTDALSQRHQAFFKVVDIYKTIVKLRRELKLFISTDQAKITVVDRAGVAAWFKDFNTCQIDVEMLRREMDVVNLLDVDMLQFKKDLSELDNFARSVLNDLSSLVSASSGGLSSELQSLDQFCFGETPSQHVKLFQSVKNQFFD